MAVKSFKEFLMEQMENKNPRNIVKKHADKKGYTIGPVYHGSNKDFNIFKEYESAMGVFWFSEDRDKIEQGESGASSTKFIKPFYLKVKKVAGWDEYEKLGLGEIEDRGFDAIKLDDDYIMFNPESIKSADIVTYKDNGDMISLKQRFDSGSDDVRY